MEYFKQYLQVCLFRSSLYDLPKSITFLQVALIFYLVIGFLIQANIGEPIQAFLETFIEIILTIILIFILLLFAGKLSTFIQTFTSFLICENVILILLLPIAIWIEFFDDLITMYVSISLVGGLIIWYLSIISYLIRQLLSISKLASFLLSVGYTLLTYVGTFLLLMY